MIKKPYYDKVREDFIASKKENSSLVSYKDYKDKKLKTYFYDELYKTEAQGYPFSSDFVDEEGNAYDFKSYEELSEEEKAKCRLRYFYLPFYHEMYVGTTGSGKTTGCLEPQIRAIGSQKNKPNIFVTDPKGELFDHHATFLKKKGYNVFILNFKDPSISNSWNPFDELYDKQASLTDLGKDYQLCHGLVPEDVRKFDDKTKYTRTYYLYDGVAFATMSSLQQYVENQKYTIKSEISSLINQISSTIIPPIPGDKDPIWRDGSRDLLGGIISGLLEESSKPGTTFTKKMMTLKTVNDVYLKINDGQNNNSEFAKVHKFFEDKSTETLSKVTSVLDSADKTRASFLSCFRAAVSNWMHGHIFKLTAETTIDLDDSKHPFAIFFVTRDYESSDDLVASLFINWVYTQVLKKVEKIRNNNPSAKVRDTHFLLDEFANIPQIHDFRRKIATARSRNIWFHIIIQNYSQLNAIYGDEVASTVWDNCNSQVFLGCQSRETKEKFSKECGMMTINGEDAGGSDVETIPVVRISDLDQIKPGTMYIKRIYTNVIKGGYIRSYQATRYFDDMYGTDPLHTLVPFNNTDVNEPSRTFYEMCPRWYKKPAVKQEPQRPQIDEDDEPDFDEDEDDDMPFFDEETAKRSAEADAFFESLKKQQEESKLFAPMKKKGKK